MYPETESSQKLAVIYCRVSTKEQADDGNSLVTQERLCREYASKEGYKVVEVFIERGESAKTADRKELQRMLAYCTSKKDIVQAVIAYKVDRISRNIADYSYIKVKLKRYNVAIKSVTEYFEDTPAGRFMENIIANVSQFDNEVRAERSTGGMREAVREGRYVWKAPLGLKNVRVNGKANIEPDENAPLVKETFELISRRLYPTDVIRLMMRDKGLQDKNGNAIGRSYFFRLIRNPLYKGVIKMFGNEIKGDFRSIVSEHLFEDVQAALKGRKNRVKHYLNENPDFPLRRFIRNPEGKLMVGYWSKGRKKQYAYYSFAIPGTTIPKNMLEEKFLNLLSHLAFDNSHLVQLKRNLNDHFSKRLNQQQLAQNAIKESIDNVNKLIDELFRMHANKSISDNIFALRIDKYEAELDELSRLLNVKTEVDFDIKSLIDSVSPVLEHPEAFWEKSDINTRRLFQRFVFPDGLEYDGVNLRTAKISNVFNLKSSFCDQEFSQVNLKDRENNTCCTHANTSLSDPILILEGVLDNLRELQCIAHPEIQPEEDDLAA